LTEAGVGTIVPTNDTEAITNALGAMVEKWQRGQLRVTPNHAVIQRCDRKQLAGQLATIFDELN
ncbi:MAG: hypothetical protein KDE31_00695, partial [Caldilineaceae bacterium]|nr:hypothetical protein [Caldilineaceae bacterium]